MTLKNVQYPPPSAIGARGGTHSFLFFLSFLFIYFFIVDITQSHLYTYYIMTSKKRVISLIRKLYDYILRVHRICTIRIYTLGYMSLIIHINYYNILIITGTFCP